MKMRVSIARALVTEPQLLLMDEPFAALDEITRFKLNDDLLTLWQELRWTVMFVTHSVFESVYLSQRIVVMTPRPGRVFTRARDRRALSARRALPHLGRLCRLLPPGSEALAGVMASEARIGRRAARHRATDAARDASSRRAAGPRARARAAGVGRWWCASSPSRPMCCRGRASCSRRLIADWRLLWNSLLVTLATTFEGFLLAAVGGIGLAVAVQPVAADRILALSLCGDPAGDAGRGDRAAAADLSAAAARRCWPAPGSSRSFRCWPTPRSA